MIVDTPDTNLHTNIFERHPFVVQSIILWALVFIFIKIFYACGCDAEEEEQEERPQQSKIPRRVFVREDE